MKKAFLILFGIVVFLFFLEISLRICEKVYYVIRSADGISLKKENRDSAQNKDNFTIFCVGDSFTHGVGAIAKFSYPKILENMLRENMGTTKKIIVRNLGSPGANSFRAMDIFIKHVTIDRPDVAILMVGMGDVWNLEGVQHFFRWNSLLIKKPDIYKLRVYKLFKILTVNLIKCGQKYAFDAKRDAIAGRFTDKYAKDNSRDNCGNIPVIRESNPSLSEMKMHREKMEYFNSVKRSDLAIREITRLLIKYPEMCSLNGEIVSYLRGVGDYNLALQYAQEALSCLKSHADEEELVAGIHQELMYIYRAKEMWGLARKEMDYALRDISNIGSVFAELKNICIPGNGLEFKKEAVTIRQAIGVWHGREGLEIFDVLLFLQKDNNALKVLAQNVNRFINVCVTNNIKLILMTYPCEVFTDAVMRELAAKHGIFLVDNYSVFKKNQFGEDFFVADGHCNERGYEVIAKNVYTAVKETISDVDAGF